MRIRNFKSFILLITFSIDFNPNSAHIPEFDPNGYLIFCLCMGRFGNQADHFLGAMTFALKLNRTMVLPHFHSAKYSDYFNESKLNEYHRFISSNDFMKYIAPKHWPPDERASFCWLPESMISSESKCDMKNGYPSEAYWSSLGIDSFRRSIIFSFDYSEHEKWREKYPPEKFKVIALKGAPAAFPVRKSDRMNQKYMIWSDALIEQANAIISTLFNNEKFVGIHLRNGLDWKNACSNVEEFDSYMASPQCLEGTIRRVHQTLCFPSNEIILKDLENVLVNKLNKTVKNIYIATDKSSMVNEISAYYKNLIPGLNVVHHDPISPIIDLIILGKSEYFIGNCVSSFTSFVKRERDINELKSTFWALEI